MKILFIAPRFHSNQNVLVQKLLEEKHEVRFYVMGLGNSEDHSNLKPTIIKESIITRFYYKFFSKKKDITAFAVRTIPSIFKYYRSVYNFNPDVVIIRYGKYPYVITIVPFLILLKVKIIYYSQHPKFSENEKLKKSFFNKLFTLNYRIGWFTPVLYRGVEKKGLKNMDFLSYIPFFMNKKNVKEVEMNYKDKLKLICVSKFEKRKNIEILLEVVNKLIINNFNLKLTIIGSTGNIEREKFYCYLNQKIKSYNLSNHIFLLKNIQYERMSEFYKSNDIFLLPTTNELASISQLEAMSYGLAIICSKDNGTASYVKNNFNGFVVSPTEKEFYNAILFYLNNKTIIGKHKINSLKLLDSEFSIERSYKKLKDLMIQNK